MTINCKGKLIDISQPKIMGILNTTPDSFFDGGKYKNESDFLHQTEKMLSQGATFIDVGAYSSKPGADAVSEDEELKRILPVVELLIKNFPSILLSIDTFRSKIANECITSGAAIINDISAGEFDVNMMKTIAKHQVPYIMMHMKGTPQTMQSLATYEDITAEVKLYFSKKVALARSLKINDIIIDPGFGFAKTVSQNYELLKNTDLLQTMELPILVGLSRKSMIYKVLETDAKNALNGTTALHMFALQKGANILRVHDVKEAMECVDLLQQLQ